MVGGEVEEMPERHSELSGGEHSGNLIQSPVRCYSSMPLDRKSSGGLITRHNVIVQFVFLPQ